MLKFLIIGDLHGVIPKIHMNFDNIDAIIAPGDFCGDDIRPYYKKLFELINETGEDSLSLDDVCPTWKQKIYEIKSQRKGRTVLSHLNSLGKPVFLVPGNWEPTEMENGKEKGSNKWDKLKKGFENIKDVENKKINFKGITFIGHGSTSAPEPLEKISKNNFDDDCEYVEYNKRVKHFQNIENKLSKYMRSSINPIIFISHNVPQNTKLDKINAPGSYVHNKHYGSSIARNLIDRHQPMLCIGGHIHEGYGKTRLRKTTCINAGFGADVNTIIEIDEKKGKVTNIEFIGTNKKN